MYRIAPSSPGFQRQYLLPILIGFGLLITVALYFANQSVDTQTSNPSHTGHPSTPGDLSALQEDVVGEGVSFTVTEGEFKRWELHVKKAIYDRRGEWADLQSVSGTFFNDDGEVVAHFKSKAGLFNQKTQAVVLKEKVVIKSVSTENDAPIENTEPSTKKSIGTILKAPQVTWQANQGDIRAEGGVQIISPGFGKSTADQGSFSLDLSKIRLEGEVVSSFDPV